MQLSPELKFAGAVGAQRRDYVNAPSRNFSGGVWNTDLTWRPRERSSVTLSGWRELRAWQDAESNHYVSRGVRVEPAWDSGFHWRLSLAASWERDAYLDRSGASSREDTLKYVEAQLRYQFLKHLQLRLSGRTERRDSSNAAYDYDTRVAGAGIAASW